LSPPASTTSAFVPREGRRAQVGWRGSGGNRSAGEGLRALGEARYGRTVQPIELGPERFEELRAFLAKDPIQNIYALGLLEDHGLGTAAEGKVACCALVEEGKLVGAAVVGGKGGMIIPCVFDPSAATELGRFLVGRTRPRSILGERQAVDAPDARRRLWPGALVQAAAPLRRLRR